MENWKFSSSMTGIPFLPVVLNLERRFAALEHCEPQWICGCSSAPECGRLLSTSLSAVECTLAGAGWCWLDHIPWFEVVLPVVVGAKFPGFLFGNDTRVDLTYKVGFAFGNWDVSKTHGWIMIFHNWVGLYWIALVSSISLGYIYHSWCVWLVGIFASVKPQQLYSKYLPVSHNTNRYINIRQIA